MFYRDVQNLNMLIREKCIQIITDDRLKYNWQDEISKII